MKDKTSKPPATREDQTPEESLERMKEFTRHLIAVPKAQAAKPKKALRKHR